MWWWKWASPTPCDPNLCVCLGLFTSEVGTVMCISLLKVPLSQRLLQFAQLIQSLERKSVTWCQSNRNIGSRPPTAHLTHLVSRCHSSQKQNQWWPMRLQRAVAGTVQLAFFFLRGARRDCHETFDAGRQKKWRRHVAVTKLVTMLLSRFVFEHM